VSFKGSEHHHHHQQKHHHHQQQRSSCLSLILLLEKWVSGCLAKILSRLVPKEIVFNNNAETGDRARRYRYRVLLSDAPTKPNGDGPHEL
jgi:hypothetical protein